MDVINKTLKRVAASISISILAAGISNTSYAADLCRKEVVVLQHKFRSVDNAELNAIKKILSLKHLTGRALIGIGMFHSTSVGSDVSCSTIETSCNKMFREAKRQDFSTYRRAKAFACSADYKVSTSVSTKWVKPTNDSLIKNQRYAIDSLGLARAWKISNGNENIVVAVIDTGADYTHPDLAQNILPGKNFSMGGLTDDAMDDNEHGTHVSGTIAAVGNNGFGVAGIAWNTKILPLKFLDSTGSGYLSDAVRAINYMVYAKDNLGLDIRAANNSWGGGAYSDALYQAISMANNDGILFIAAAGNDSSDNDAFKSYPADYDLPNVVSVAAYDQDLTLAYFSNYGSHSVDIAAPGDHIASTIPGARYAYLSGTSMATPHVTGAIALLAAVNPGLSAADLKARMLATARYNPELKGYVRDGAQLNVLNMLRDRKTESLAVIKANKSHRGG